MNNLKRLKWNLWHKEIIVKACSLSDTSFSGKMKRYLSMEREYRMLDTPSINTVINHFFLK